VSSSTLSKDSTKYKKDILPQTCHAASPETITTPIKDSFLDSLPVTHQLLILSLAMFTFFGVHNILQEAISTLPGFSYGVMLGYMEVIGVTTCSFLERTFNSSEKDARRAAPLKAYLFLTTCLISSSACSTAALNYINFPTKVIFRSCKLIPTMILSTIMNKRHFTTGEYLAAFGVCMGLIFFAAADWQMASDANNNLVGYALITISVIADSILPNAQEKLFKMGSTRLEVTLYSNFFSLIAMTGITFFSGDLVGIIRHAMSDRVLLTYMVVFTAISYVAVSSYMEIVKRFGGVAGAVVATARKGMTLCLSFLLFPKAFHCYYVIGAILVLGGVFSASMIKQKQRRKQTTTDNMITKELSKSDEEIGDVTGEDIDEIEETELINCTTQKPEA